MDLRRILAQNIKNSRKNLQVSRAKLAENAGVSLPYLADIERCRTWVSDKTLQSLADALNLEPCELICADMENEREKSRGQSKESRKQMAEVVTVKKEILCKTVENVMEDLILELVKKAQ
jgi:transcriptional regulator with XRE-family HTH domain